MLVVITRARMPRRNRAVDACRYLAGRPLLMPGIQRTLADALHLGVKRWTGHGLILQPQNSVVVGSEHEELADPHVA